MRLVVPCRGRGWQGGGCSMGSMGVDPWSRFKRRIGGDARVGEFLKVGLWRAESNEGKTRKDR